MGMKAVDGDEDAFRKLTDPYRRELQVHLYRLVGSLQDAEDLLQETLLAAWRGLEQFEERTSIRTWLYRIAANRALDALGLAIVDRTRGPVTHLPRADALERAALARAVSRRPARRRSRRGARARRRGTKRERRSDSP